MVKKIKKDSNAEYEIPMTTVKVQPRGLVIYCTRHELDIIVKMVKGAEMHKGYVTIPDCWVDFTA